MVYVDFCGGLFGKVVSALIAKDAFVRGYMAKRYSVKEGFNFNLI